MQQFRCLLLFVLHFLLFIPCVAQLKQSQALIDSLLGQLPKMADDTNKVLVMWRICYTYCAINPEEGIKYGEKVVALSEKIHWKKGSALGYANIGNNYLSVSDYPKALENYAISLKICEEMEWPIGIAANYEHFAIIYESQSDYPKALEYYLKALKIFEKTTDKEETAIVLGDIGGVYSDQTIPDYTKAREYALKALKMIEETGNTSATADNLDAIGNTYTLQSKPDYPKALEYLFKSLTLSEKTGMKGNTASASSDIARVYFRIAVDTNTSLLNEFFKGSKTEALQASKKYLDSAIVINKELDIPDHLQHCYQTMSETEAALGDYKAALESTHNYTAIKDTLFNNENRKKIAQIESERSEYLARQKAEGESHKRNLQLVGIALFIITFLVFVILLSKVRLSLMAIRFLGILGLLMLFEFINLLIDPIVAESTNDNPVYKLGAMVGIAAIIIPTHHKLEHWTKHWLEKRNVSVKQKIRKKVIESDDSENAHDVNQ